MTEHDRWVDAAGAYVLGAMPARERAQFESHLATCTTCQAEIDELRPAAEALPMASPPMRPPAALKDRIMAEVEREAALLAEAGPAADRPEPARERRRRFRLSLGWQIAPVAALLIVVAVLAVAALGGGAQTFTADVSATGATAHVKVDDDRATLVAENLPAPPGGKVYEVWLMPKGSDVPEPTSVLFKPRGDGSVEAELPGSVADVGQVLVTDEPPTGTATPTGDVLISATLS
jgi:anti-sigma-K factor RskA